MPNLFSENRTKTKKIVLSGIIGGLYVVLSLLTLPVASGAIQFRVSEGLTLLPLFFIEAVPGLFFGCMLSNIITGCMALDVILGSLTTLLASILTYLVGKMFKSHALRISIGGFFPVILNALFLPLVWLLCYGAIEYVYYLQVLFLLISQSVSVYAIGTPIYLMLNKQMLKENK
jgi:uncharacterized membrane protein